MPTTDEYESWKLVENRDAGCIANVMNAAKMILLIDIALRPNIFAIRAIDDIMNALIADCGKPAMHRYMYEMHIVAIDA